MDKESVFCKKPRGASSERSPWTAWSLIGVSLLLVSCGGVKATSEGETGPEIQSGLSYVLDRTWPASRFPFKQVTWMKVHPETGQIYLLQRSQPPVSVWTPGGGLVRTWNTQALGDPHSLSLQTQENAAPRSHRARP